MISGKEIRMRILRSSKRKSEENRRLPLAQQAPECPKHGVMRLEGNRYVCKTGCFSMDQRLG